MASAIFAASRPYKIAAVTEAPIVPQMDVAWKPFSKKIELPALGI